MKRLERMKWRGWFWSFAVEDCEGSPTYPVWPWRFGWHSSQMYECLFLGLCYLCWVMA